MSDLTALIALSRRYGSDPEWVLAGGGNTSYKEAGRLFVKASGTSLGSITDAGFCSIDRARLDAMWRATYPAEAEAREAAALAAARGMADVAAEIQSRQRLYEAGKPYRTPPRSP